MFDDLKERAENDPKFAEAMSKIAEMLIDSLNPNLRLILRLKKAKTIITGILKDGKGQIGDSVRSNIEEVIADLHLVTEQLENESGLDDTTREMIDELK